MTYLIAYIFFPPFAIVAFVDSDFRDITLCICSQFILVLGVLMRVTLTAVGEVDSRDT